MYRRPTAGPFLTDDEKIKGCKFHRYLEMKITQDDMIIEGENNGLRENGKKALDTKKR